MIKMFRSPGIGRLRSVWREREERERKGGEGRGERFIISKRNKDNFI